LAKLLFGDEPIRTVWSNSDLVNDFLQNVGVGPKTAATMAPLLVVGSIGADLFLPGAGTAGRKTGQQFLKETAETIAKKGVKEATEATAKRFYKLPANKLSEAQKRAVDVHVALANRNKEQLLRLKTTTGASKDAQRLEDVANNFFGKTVKELSKKEGKMAAHLVKQKRLTPFLDAIISGGKKADTIRSQSKALVRATSRGMEMSQIDTGKIVNEMLQTMSDVENVAAAFLRGGMRGSEDYLVNYLRKLGIADEVVALMKNPTPGMRKSMLATQKYFDESWDLLKQQFGELGYRESYLTGIWGKKSLTKFFNANPTTARTLVDSTRIFQSKVIPSLDEGMKLGLEPRLLKLTDYVAQYDYYKTDAIFKSKFMDEILNLTDKKGMRLVLPAGEAPSNWVKFVNEDFSKRLRHKIGFQESSSRELIVEQIQRAGELAVHPSIVRDLNAIEA
jgi:hypothetical protein